MRNVWNNKRFSFGQHKCHHMKLVQSAQTPILLPIIIRWVVLATVQVRNESMKTPNFINWKVASCPQHPTTPRPKQNHYDSSHWSPAPRGKGKLRDSGHPNTEPLSPLGPYDKHASVSSDSYILLKPTCSRRDANSGTVSKSPSVQLSALSSNVFPISEDSESNPLYIPDSCLNQVRWIADDLQHRRGASSDLFGAIDLTFDSARCRRKNWLVHELTKLRSYDDTTNELW